MAQAKGVLPRRDDREVLYKNPRTCGYFIGVKLDPAITRERVEAWLSKVDTLINELVARLPAHETGQKGEKVAAVAVGLAPSFFILNGASRFGSTPEPPASFTRKLPNSVPPLSNAPLVDADVFFYVASVFEARVNAFVNELAHSTNEVLKTTLDRGFQRLDDTEPFGYKDGLRNVRTNERPRFVFIHRDEDELDEPVWAEGGSYMVFMRIQQKPEVFASLPDDTARDAVMGRMKDGTRLDLVGQGIDPRSEPNEPLPNLPGNSHVLKSGPRGVHDDTQVFRRGMPFMETTPEGSLRVGLNFCSFQASLEQFDVVFNDWMMNAQFPPQAGSQVGVDALLDPARQFTAIERVGFFFVPPYQEEGLAAAIFNDRGERRRDSGRLVVHKRVVDASDPSRRFERGRFRFEIHNAQDQLVPDSEFSTNSTGRGVCPVELTIGQTYILKELSSPVPNVSLVSIQFVMDKHNQQLQITNEVTQPNTPYGG